MTTRLAGAAPGVVPPAVHAFDRLAPRYDALCSGELFDHMRRRVHARLHELLSPGARVLEIGCGTGLDTAWLAEAGADVIAADPSAAMIARARTRIAGRRAGGSARFLCCGLEDLAQHLGSNCQVDLILSNFGALNCVPRLDALGELAAFHLASGGRTLVCLISKNCAWEMAWFLARRDVRRAFRRRGPAPVAVPVEGIEVPTWYHAVGEVARRLAPALGVVRVTGLNVLAPPPYLEPRWQQAPAVLRRALLAADAAVATVPPFDRLGDHVLIELAREGR